METLLRTPKLLPHPQNAIWGGGFLDWTKAEFQIDENGLPCGDFLSIVESPDIASCEGYKLSINQDGIAIAVSHENGARRALNTLQQIGMQADERGFRYCEISDFPNVEVRTFSLNLSQGRVPTLEQLKLIVDRIALFKFNRLELNLTGAFPFEQCELQWAGKAVFSPSRISRLKNYCEVQGIELALAYDVSSSKIPTETLKELADNFACVDVNIVCQNAEKIDICKYVDCAINVGLSPTYCADSFVNADFDATTLPAGTPIFSVIDGDLLEDICQKLKSSERKFYLRIDMSLQKFSNYAKSRSQIEVAETLLKKYGASGIIADFSLGEFTPICALYPQAILVASMMWSDCATDESVCEALESFVFYDENGDFSRAVFAMGNVIKSELIYDMFFADENSLREILSKNSDVDFDVLEGSADFAMGLCATSKAGCRDANILSAEFALTGAMMKWAIQKSRLDDTKKSQQELALKFIIADFENVWLARNECGGMWEASAKLRNISV